MAGRYDNNYCWVWCGLLNDGRSGGTRNLKDDPRHLLESIHFLAARASLNRPGWAGEGPTPWAPTAAPEVMVNIDATLDLAEDVGRGPRIECHQRARRQRVLSLVVPRPLPLVPLAGRSLVG